jgi:hypothetical protein
MVRAPTVEVVLEIVSGKGWWERTVGIEGCLGQGLQAPSPGVAQAIYPYRAEGSVIASGHMMDAASQSVATEFGPLKRDAPACWMGFTAASS